MAEPRTPGPALQVLGAINVDLVARVPRAPERGETVLGGELTTLPGGKGANQASAAARLGGRVRMLGAVGRDATGSASVDALADAGVDTSAVQRADVPTGTALIVLDAEGENSIVVCPGANDAIDAAALDVDPHGPLLAQLEVDPAVLAEAASRTDGFFALNFSPPADLPDAVIDRVDLFIVNEGEYRALPDRARDGAVVVTLGADGARFLDGGVEVARATSPAVEVASTVGAGDAFAAALTVALLSGWDRGAALAAACAVGSAAVADPRSQPALNPLASYRA
jgi:ribokinase